MLQWTTRTWYDLNATFPKLAAGVILGGLLVVYHITTFVVSIPQAGHTALHYAAIHGHEECVRLLLVHNADASLQVVRVIHLVHFLLLGSLQTRTHGWFVKVISSMLISLSLHRTARQRWIWRVSTTTYPLLSSYHVLLL